MEFALPWPKPARGKAQECLGSRSQGAGWTTRCGGDEIDRRPHLSRRIGEVPSEHGGGGEREEKGGMDLGFEDGALGPLIARERPPDTLAGPLSPWLSGGEKQRGGSSPRCKGGR